MTKPKEESAISDRVWGVMGIVMGLLITVIGLDLLSGGLISRTIGTPIDEGATDEIQSDEPISD